MTSKITLTREQSRRVDKIAIEKYGIPGIVLMENAGRGLAEQIFKRSGRKKPQNVCICCGKGNNAGDGLVLARYLYNSGYSPKVCFWHNPAELRGDAEIFYNVAVNIGISVDIFTESSSADFAEMLEKADWIVDALLGTGMQGTPREPYASVIAQLNATKATYENQKTILSVDIPSGLDVDTGRSNQPTIMADITCTFVSLKTGFTAPEAAGYLGELEVLEIGIPKKIVEEAKSL